MRANMARRLWLVIQCDIIDNVIPIQRKEIAMTKTKTVTKYPLIAFRLTSEMAKQIATRAKEDKVSKSAVIKTAIENYLKKR
jgi:hypothetical protein